MKTSLKVGLRYQHKFTVPKSKTVPNLYPESEEFKIMLKYLQLDTWLDF